MIEISEKGYDYIKKNVDTRHVSRRRIREMVEWLEYQNGNKENSLFQDIPEIEFELEVDPIFSKVKKNK